MSACDPHGALLGSAPRSHHSARTRSTGAGILLQHRYGRQGSSKAQQRTEPPEQALQLGAAPGLGRSRSPLCRRGLWLLREQNATPRGSGGNAGWDSALRSLLLIKRYLPNAAGPCVTSSLGTLIVLPFAKIPLAPEVGVFLIKVSRKLLIFN